jgi:hypothetical protein
MPSSVPAQAREHKNLHVVYGACPHDCPDCCALETHIDEQGRAVQVRGRTDHPVTRGWLCAKVNNYLERVYHPDELSKLSQFIVQLTLSPSVDISCSYPSSKSAYVNPARM